MNIGRISPSYNSCGDDSISITHEYIHDDSESSNSKGKFSFFSSIHSTYYPDDSNNHDVLDNSSFSQLSSFSYQPAKNFPFILDPFQKIAIDCIERNHNLLVATHTSSGKTVIAEYAIALALKKSSRVIYTSPIKALSNQKYREMKTSFNDVGLITGDITLNPNASCIIMTTEILRNFLYQSSEIIKEVSWIIFDEIHYLRDVERGVIWEETIILLPPSIRLVFLSATLPNSFQFAEWVGTLKNVPIDIIQTDTRPVPICHYIYPYSANEPFLCIDESGSFLSQNFALCQSSSDSIASYSSLISFLNDHNDLPAIIFTFSRKECEVNALSLINLDLTTEDEKTTITQIFTNAINCLSDKDKELLQIQNALPLLTRGIGIHHGGLLPILKEVTEILFQESLTKVLIATETFALGVNMPAKSVIFSTITKYDGQNFRHISSGEYIQMSGRAGRRGIDEKGLSIVMLSSPLELSFYQSLTLGPAPPLISSFHLTFNMVLNNLRTDIKQTNNILKQSFLQFLHYQSLPKIYKQIEKTKKEIKKIESYINQEFQDYLSLHHLYHELMISLSSFISFPHISLPFLVPGRVVYLADSSQDFGWGIILFFYKKYNPDDYVMDIMVPIGDILSISHIKIPKPFDYMKSNYSVEVVKFSLKMICKISDFVIDLTHFQNLTHPETRNSLYQILFDLVEKYNNDIPCLDLYDDLHIPSEQIEKTHSKMKNIHFEMAKLPQHSLPFNDIEKCLQQETILKKYRVELDQYLSITQNDSFQQFQEELQKYHRILRRLGHINEDNFIQIKGRFAVEIEAVNELILTELIFDGVFNDLDIGQSLALLSCLFDETRGKTSLSEEFSTIFNLLLQKVEYIYNVYLECRIKIPEHSQYIAQFHNNCMLIVYNYVNDISFQEICQQTTIMEGTIVRLLRRIDELCQQIIKGCNSIGNDELATKFQQARKSLQQGIAFAGSLYI